MPIICPRPSVLVRHCCPDTNHAPAFSVIGPGRLCHALILLPVSMRPDFAALGAVFGCRLCPVCVCVRFVFFGFGLRIVDKQKRRRTRPLVSVLCPFCKFRSIFATFSLQPFQPVLTIRLQRYNNVSDGLANEGRVTVPASVGVGCIVRAVVMSFFCSPLLYGTTMAACNA